MQVSQILSEPSDHNYRLITVLKTQLRLYDWVHHFEKMLYDNALLGRAYLHAWQVMRDPFYKRIAEETLDFVAREMTHQLGGFILRSTPTRKVWRANSTSGLSTKSVKS